MSKYGIAVELAEEALKNLLHPPEKDRASATEILQWVQEHRPEQYEEVKRSWGSFLTAATDDPESRLMREPGRYGYMLRDVPTVPTSQPFDLTNEMEATKGDDVRLRVPRERNLYGIQPIGSLQKDTELAMSPRRATAVRGEIRMWSELN
jgi:hypothetical protein